MGRVTYRRLVAAEARELAAIDRAEHIDGVYRVLEGKLVLEPADIEVAGWEQAELALYVARLEDLLDSGGVVLGAWHENQLVGLGALDVRPVGGSGALLKLDMLYVSAAQRRRGLGRELCSLLCAEARSRGATGVYVSASPTRSTVQAYLRCGARLLQPPDAELFRLEPEDVHLVIEL
jgi:predicted N-acetyltransferase YhbS